METTHSGDDRWIVMVQGELDLSTTHHLAEMAEILSALGRDVDLDLSGVSFIDSCGWEGVVDSVEALRAAGVSARVTELSDPVRRVKGILDRSLLPTAA